MKYYMVSEDDGSRESCSIFYSTLVIAESEEEALEKYRTKLIIDNSHYDQEDIDMDMKRKVTHELDGSDLIE